MHDFRAPGGCRDQARRAGRDRLAHHHCPPRSRREGRTAVSVVRVKIRHTLSAEENVPGTHTTIPCPSSPAHYFVVRENSVTGHLFLGCSHYPECAETAEIVLVA